MCPPPITALAYRPDGQLLVAGRQHEIVLIRSGVKPQAITLPGGKVTALAFSPDGKLLAVACSQVGLFGEIHLLEISSDEVVSHPASTLEAVKAKLLEDAFEIPEKVQVIQKGRFSSSLYRKPIQAHKDAILSLAFSPDGKLLSSTGYDRVIKIWKVADHKELQALRDHSDTVYSLAWHPNSKLLASAAADRAVKLWDVTTGQRLHTLSEATDWLYAVAISPDGKHIAAGGVDKSIRVWEITPSGGRFVQSVFAHEAAVSRLLYSADGKRLYSLGEDRVLKSWHTDRMVEHKIYARQPEAVLSLALRPDQQQLALGRYDGTLTILEESTGKVLSEPLPVKPQAPVLSRIEPDAGVQAQTQVATLHGENLDDAAEVVPTRPELNVKLLPAEAGPGKTRQVHIEVAASANPGKYEFSLKGPGGQSKPFVFYIDPFTPVNEVEPNDSARTGQRVKPPVTVVGKLARAGEVDYFRFEAEAAQMLGVQAFVTAKPGSFDPVLVLLDEHGQQLAESSNGLLGHQFAKEGVYALGLRDRDYRGGPDMTYRLHIGHLPVVTNVFPLGIQRGTEAAFHADGVFLERIPSYRLTAPPNAAPGTRLPLPVKSALGKPLGNPSVIVGEFPELVASRDGASSTAHNAPWTANGTLAQPGATDTWRFRAKKGERLIFEVNARRLGSPLDSYLEILDAKGQPVPLATLRCQAQTFVTFRDHDSAGAGIRIETWNEFAIDDYVWVGGQLLRILALPKNPDDDCQFHNLNGTRLGFLGTTPLFVSLGTPIYKVSIHPPGTSFPPNGFPIIHLMNRNDDGGPGFGKDSRIVFDAPADAEYQVRIGDTRGWGGKDYTYRLTARSPRPGFTVAFNPTAPAVWKGGALPVSVTATRIDGFDGPIELKLENLPSGFHAPASTIPAGETATAFALSADATASAPAKGQTPCKLIASATIDGKLGKQEVIGGVPTLREGGDIRTTTEQAEITVKPGQIVTLTANIERRPGFKSRVPLDVRGLPHGVRVLDIGLNGILITEQETRRTMQIYVEPWVMPTAHPIVVLARSEPSGTEHAARTVLLRVVGGP